MGGSVVKGDREYWHALINEKQAAEFLGLKTRSMQAMRQRSGGPEFVRLSQRCIRYRRHDLKEWADSRLFNSTKEGQPKSDQFNEAESARRMRSVLPDSLWKK